MTEGNESLLTTFVRFSPICSNWKSFSAWPWKSDSIYMKVIPKTFLLNMLLRYYSVLSTCWSIFPICMWECYYRQLVISDKLSPTHTYNLGISVKAGETVCVSRLKIFFGFIDQCFNFIDKCGNRLIFFLCHWYRMVNI